MCGIAGWVRSPGDVRAQAVPDELVAMADLQAHRGPDDRGYHVDPAGGLALAHNRLSIIDLSPAGRQPMFNEDRTIALAFNGEIYNFQKLRSKLVASGHQFRSKTDSEVILHAYEEWGQECVEKFCGMFAFVLWDCRRRELFAARDPLGIKPFYYWTGPDEGFYFASEMKAFRGLRAFTPRPCQRAVRQFLEMNFIYDEELTALEEVCKLPPGHLLTVSGAASGASRGPARTIRRRRWWSPPPVRPSPAGTSLAEDEAERVERFAGVFRQAVEQHLIADVRVGVLLSGGLDSSLVASVAQKLLGAGQRLVTIRQGF